MHRAEALADWIAPGWGHRLLRHAFISGEVAVYAAYKPPATVGPIVEVMEDGSEISPDWWQNWTNEPLQIEQVEWVCTPAFCKPPGFAYDWQEWFNHSLSVDHEALARRFDRLFASTSPSQDKTDRAMWTPPEALAWIASRDMQLVESLRPQAWETPPKAWSHPVKVLIWQLARRDGTWPDLPSRHAPAARQAFDKLLAALRGRPERLPGVVRRDGKGQEAQPADFAFAAFDPHATALDLACGMDVRLDSIDVQRLWLADGQDLPPYAAASATPTKKATLPPFQAPPCRRGGTNFPLPAKPPRKTHW